MFIITILRCPKIEHVAKTLFIVNRKLKKNLAKEKNLKKMPAFLNCWYSYKQRQILIRL